MVEISNYEQKSYIGNAFLSGLGTYSTGGILLGAEYGHNNGIQILIGTISSNNVWYRKKNITWSDWTKWV